MALGSAELATSGFALGLLLASCVQASQTYPLITTPRASGCSGRVQVENVEGGKTLFVVELEQLPPPRAFASELTEFVVWLEDPQGGQVKAGTLRYDPARRAGNLLGTTRLHAFTVRVTGERHANSDTPSDVVLASRKVTTH